MGELQSAQQAQPFADRPPLPLSLLNKSHLGGKNPHSNWGEAPVSPLLQMKRQGRARPGTQRAVELQSLGLPPPPRWLGREPGAAQGTGRRVCGELRLRGAAQRSKGTSKCPPLRGEGRRAVLGCRLAFTGGPRGPGSGVPGKSLYGPLGARCPDRSCAALSPLSYRNREGKSSPVFFGTLCCKDLPQLFSLC